MCIWKKHPWIFMKIHICVCKNTGVTFLKIHSCIFKVHHCILRIHLYFQNTPLYFEVILKTNQKFFVINFSENLWRKSKYTPVFWSPPLYFQNTCMYYENTPVYFQNTSMYFKIQGCILGKIYTPVFSRNPSL